MNIANTEMDAISIELKFNLGLKINNLVIKVKDKGPGSFARPLKL